MPLDAYVAFGGVALLGFIGFWAAWFSQPKNEAAAGNTRASKKRLLADEIAEVEKKLHEVSTHIARL